MAEIVKVIQTGAGFECQICGVPWIPKRLTRKPIRCNNPKCRSRRWDAEKYPNAGPPRPPAPDGGVFDESPNGGNALPRTCYQTLPLSRKPAASAFENLEPVDAAA